MDTLVEERLARIEVKLDRLLNLPAPETLDLAQAMALLGAKSKATFYRLLQQLDVKPYTTGRYRRSELENAMAKLALKSRLKTATQT